MTDLPHGGPAFPCHTPSSHPQIDGMSLRDYFAAAMLPAASQVQDERFANSPEEGAAHVAKICYYFADAMLAERDHDGS